MSPINPNQNQSSIGCNFQDQAEDRIENSRLDPPDRPTQYVSPAMILHY